MPVTRATAHRLVHVMTTSLVVLAAGCGTIDNQLGFWAARGADAERGPAVMVFGGLVADIKWSGLLFSGERWSEAGVFVMLPVWAIDVPLSLVADTLLLPMTLIQQVL